MVGGERMATCDGTIPAGPLEAPLAVPCGTYAQTATMDATTAPHDGDLLARFAQQRDEAAFAALVERHHGLVQGVALRVLGTHADAEDAAQAVFLTLARKAHALASSRSLAPWLHHVARCVARTALQARHARDHHERQAGQQASTEAGDGADAALVAELRGRLDQELARLPERYRAPLILVHLEGRSLADAARILARPLGTVGACLSRGRTLLRARLARGGMPVAESAVGAALAASPAVTPASSAAIAASICQTVFHGAAPGSAVLALSNGALHMLRLAALKFVAAMIGIGIAVIAAGSAVATVMAAEPAPIAAPPTPDAASPALAGEVAALGARIAQLEHDRVDYGALAASGVLEGMAHDESACLFDPSGSLSMAAVTFLQLSAPEHAQLDRIISDTLARLAADLHAHGAHGDGSGSDRTAYLPSIGQDALTARADFEREVAAVLGRDRGRVLLDCLQSHWNDRFLGFCAYAQTVHASRSKNALHIEHHFNDTGNSYGGIAPSPTYALKYTLCAPYLQIDLASKDAPTPKASPAPPSAAGSGF
jgi:RNA polymerase sigma factor (sigma-70 family)